MRTATVRDLRNHFAKLSKWIEQGEEIELTKRGKVVAKIVPAISKPKPLSTEEWMARLKRIYGDKVTSDSQTIIDDGRGEN